jgi:hypothetical protein
MRHPSQSWHRRPQIQHHYNLIRRS